MTEPLSNNQIFIRRLTEIIHANLADEDFGVNELAHELGMSLYRLNRKLNSINKKTCNQFIREVRLEKAYELLQEESYTVAEVAYKTGFGSSNYFNKCFHEYFGYPPGSVKKADPAINEEINPAQVAVKEGKKRLTWRTLIFILSGILFLVALSYLVSKIFLKNSSGDASGPAIKPEKSVAILPFKNLSDSTNNQYFIDGIMEDILTNLSRIHDLKVISRTSVEQFRESTITVSEIAKKLHVEYIVEGSGQKYGSIFRLRVQLIEASTDKHIWAESYEQEIKETKDIFKIQYQIAQAIATELKAAITPEEQQLIEKTPTTDLTAYDFYQRGRAELAKLGYSRFDAVVVKRAEVLFQNALEYDPKFAEAYVGLAHALWIRWYRDNILLENKNLNNYMDSMLVLADDALSYDDQLAEAYIVRGEYYSVKGTAKQAIEEWNKAIKCDPNNWHAYGMKGGIYEELDILKSLEYLQKAAFLNHGPELPDLLTRIGYDYYQAGFPEKGNYYILEALKLDGDSLKYFDNLARYAAETESDYSKAIDHFEKRYLTDSTNTEILVLLGYYNSIIGQYKESLKYYKKYISIYKAKGQSAPPFSRITLIGYTYLQNGYNKEAEYYSDRQIEAYNNRLKSVRPGEKIYWIYPIASIYAYRGDKVKAYENLKIFDHAQSFTLKWVTLIKNDPQFNNIRNEPKFQEIVRDVETKFQTEHERVRKWLEEQGKL